VTATYRPATPADMEHVEWALYTALDWNPERELPPMAETLEHPEAARYHRDWGRPGDLGVIACDGDEVIGMAYCRLFTDEDHGYGYVDSNTPEVAIAVRDGSRGRGIGAELLTRLAAAAGAEGRERLSLSVEARNPARDLYERLGFRTVSIDGDAVRMVLDLRPSQAGAP
jgi:ribosomal protein S18 acetylase RimI-like enzyme